LRKWRAERNGFIGLERDQWMKIVEEDKAYTGL
jgi:hypothetical protein